MGSPDETRTIAASGVAPLDPGSLTYEAYFGLNEKPFSLSPNPRFFYQNAPHAAAFDELLAGIRRREGILSLTGEVGTGKTTLCRAVLQSLDRKTFAAFIPDPILSREDLLKTLLVDFGVVSVDEIRSGRLRGASRTELAYPLFEFLTSLQPLQAFAVVMIDEAQNLPTQLLEEIRILCDMENRQKLLQLLLIGQPELQARLAMPEMRQLTQRLSVRCELKPLARRDVSLYIAHRLSIAGSSAAIFKEAACDVVATASGGIPRIINLLCDRALFRARRDGVLSVGPDHVMAAGDDLSIATDDFRQPIPDVQYRPPQELDAEESMAAALAALHAKFDRPVLTREAMRAPRPAGITAFDIAPDEIVPVALAGQDSAGTPKLFGNKAEELLRRWRKPAAIAAVALAILTALFWSFGSTSPAVPGDRVEAVSPPISVEAPRRQQEKELPPAPAAQAGESQFAVQMASFQSAARAEQSAREFQSAGYPAYTRMVPLGNGKTVHAVLLGPYTDLAPAERDRDRAKQVPGYGAGHIVPAGPAGPPTPAVPRP